MNGGICDPVPNSWTIITMFACPHVVLVPLLVSHKPTDYVLTRRVMDSWNSFTIPAIQTGQVAANAAQIGDRARFGMEAPHPAEFEWDDTMSAQPSKRENFVVTTIHVIKWCTYWPSSKPTLPLHCPFEV